MSVRVGSGVTVQIFVAFGRDGSAVAVRLLVGTKVAASIEGNETMPCSQAESKMPVITMTKMNVTNRINLSTFPPAVPIYKESMTALLVSSCCINGAMKFL